MKRKAVSSSNLQSVGYDPVMLVLEIHFHSGRTYQYLGVRAATYRRLMKAESVGEFFDKFIRGQYPYGEVTDVDKDFVPFA